MMDQSMGNDLPLPDQDDSKRETTQTTANSVDSSFSLRPNYSKGSRFSFNQAPTSTSTFAGGRKRQRSFNEDVPQSSSSASMKKIGSQSVSDSIKPEVESARYIPPQKKSEIENGRHRGSIILSLAENTEVEQQASTHCNKLFALKASRDHPVFPGTQMGSGALEHGDFVLPPADKLLSSTEWKLEGMQRLKHQLNYVKGQTERGEDMNCWTDHTRDVNPAEKVFPNIRQRTDPEFISQAYLKFYEVLCRYPVVPAGTTRLSSVHLCEAPGAFIMSLNHYLKLHHPQAQWQWLGNTLHPHYEGSLAYECISDDRIILPSLPHWVFGPNGTGDITRRCCLNEISERCLAMDEPVTLVSADGSIDCQSNPSEQEHMTSYLHFCEVVTGLHILAAGGHMVVKMFTLFEASSINLLYLLCCAFDEVHVFKPITSKLGNSEVYVISLGYRGRDSIGDQLDKLLEVYSSKELSAPIFAKSDLPDTFLASVGECAEFFMDHQIAAIDRNARLYQNMSDLDKAMCDRLKDLVWNHFSDINRPIHYIQMKDRILDVKIQWDKNINTTFKNQKKWTGRFARLRLNDKIAYVEEYLSFLVKEYAYLEKRKDIYFKGHDQVLECLRTTRGKPFEFIGTSRFCSPLPLNLYITIAELRRNIREKIQSHTLKPNDGIIIWKEENSPSTIIQTDYDTQKLLKGMETDYQRSNFLMKAFPEHLHSPSSSCDTLEYLYRLLENKSLQDNSTVYLLNFPLLSRLQNSLFVCLASCFEEVELHQGLIYQVETGFLTPPVIKLAMLNVERSEAIVKGLQDVGWTEGAASQGVMELIDAATLINCRSHELVCRYNAQLLLVWSTAALPLLKEECRDSL